MIADRTPHRYKFVLDEFSEYLDGKILDVGCYKAHLRNFFKNRYTGIDIGGKPDIKLNFEKDRLPFRKNQFDCIICLDVLEHVDNAHELLKTLINISSKHMIISLPNEHYWRFRILHILGKSNNREWGFFPENRHKWFSNYNQVKKFIKNFAKENRLKIIREEKYTQKDKMNRILPKCIYTKLRDKFPNFFTETTFFVLKKT